MKNPGSKTGFIALAGSALIGIHYYIFQQFFPNNQGKLGIDYGWFFPDLLEGYYWFNVNGLFSVPWFTPAFCGGLPRFANPQGAYYSVPQFFSFAFNPLTGVKLTLLLFAGLGFWGFYILLRRIFNVGKMTGLLGATLFLFNGFYASGMIRGQLVFHSFMLFPFIVYWVVRSVHTDKGFRAGSFISDIVLASVTFAYIFYSGGFHVLPQMMTAVIISVLIYGLLFRETFKPALFTLKLTLSAGLALAFSSSKLVSALSYIKFFPRDLYPLPGIPNLWDLIVVTMGSLFWTPPVELAREVITNIRWHLDRHEWEYGVTFIPLAILLFGSGAALYKLYCQKSWERPPLDQSIKAFAIILLLLVPLALNYYSPEWNSFLKSTPFFKSSSTLVRWFCTYIPIVIILAAVTVEKTPLLSRYNSSIAIIGILVVVGFNIWSDRDFYHKNGYNPDEIIEGYYKVKSGNWSPEITHVAVTRSRSGQVVPIKERDNILARGHSQLLCYEPLFGYNLEKFPAKTLRPGPIMLESSGVLNIKNPACYVFPEENNCSPGDHFTVDQKREADALAHYKSYPFRISQMQKIANVASLLTLFAYIVYFTFRISRFVATKVYRKTEPAN